MADDGWNSDEDRANRLEVENQTRLTRGKGHERGHVQSYGYTNSVPRTCIEIPTSFVGRVIGRGGSKIRELETESGCSIRIGDTRRKTVGITLVGTEDSKEKARILIEALTEDNTRQQYPSSDYSTPTSDYNFNEPEEEEEEDDSGAINWEKLNADHKQYMVDLIKSLPRLIKDFYVEDSEIAGMSVKEVDKWRFQNNNITVERICDAGVMMASLLEIPNPVHTFEQAFQEFPGILEEVRLQDFKVPSPIQAQAWPILLRGQDMIGIAQTGTGKTLAFLLPALIHIERQPTPMEQREGPTVLILAPTRELALQIQKEVDKYKYKGIKSVCLYGGGNRSEQIETVSRGVQIVIATPGRLNDLVKAKHVSVASVSYLVLDEADRMLDMGFGPQIRVCIVHIRPDRQTVMTSATWPTDVQFLAEGYMKNPIRVVVGTLDLAAVHSVTQEMIFFQSEDNYDEKFSILVNFLRSMKNDEKVIVFCGRKATAVAVSSDIALLGIHYQSIYGGLVQCEREQALEDMRTGEVNILIATDIASRGIDIENITHIINFDCPNALEEFVHRVGRTGRAGKKGTAITYMTRRDWAKAPGLVDILVEADQFVPPALIDMAERFKKKVTRYNEWGRPRPIRGRKRF